MTQVSAHHARNHFAEIIDMSQREPVEIAKHGRIVSILMSKNEYDLMRHIMDEWWMSAAHTDVSTDSAEEHLKKLQRSFKDAKAGRGVKRDLLT
ncbi:MAG: Antitoxin Phd YefM, type toxin-antitoxin system [Alphaproteobacteria bacterium]|jgi:prevent-host-death family protein|nr:Antitoxin Phd YefM, type toxin-antitoxin system [Alphaproteobacteria bacterium]